MPTASLTLDLSSSIPASVTFARTGTRNYNTNSSTAGTMSSVATGVAAFESGKGLSLNAASTNLIPTPNNFAGTGTNVTFTASQTGPDGTASATLVTENTAAGVHRFLKDVTIVAGDTVSWSIYIKPLTQSLFKFNLGNSSAAQWYVDLRAGTMIAVATPNVSGGNGWDNTAWGLVQLANGWWWVWGTARSIGLTSASLSVGGLFQDTGTTQATNSYTGTNQTWLIAYDKMAKEQFPTAYGSGTNADSAYFLTSLTSNSTGTFLIEHDHAYGTILGSDANVICTATEPGLTAIAYDGTGTVQVSNGGTATTSGTPLTFGTNMYIGGTSAATTNVHIKKVYWYNTKLSTTDLQSITTPTATVGAKSRTGALRVITTYSKLPKTTTSMASNKTAFVGRFPMTIGSGTVNSITLSFNNWYMASSGETDISTQTFIEEACIECDNTNYYLPITFNGGQQGIMLPIGAHDIQSDKMNVSSFLTTVGGGSAGISTLAQGTKIWVRVKAHVTASGNNIPGTYHKTHDATGFSTGAVQCIGYNPTDTSYSTTYSTGNMTVTGATYADVNFGICPVVLGTYSSGDPATFFGSGDSFLETEGSSTIGTGYLARAMTDDSGNKWSYLEACVGGLTTPGGSGVNWKALSFAKYARVMVDHLGDSSFGQYYHYHQLRWRMARNYGIERIIKVKWFPKTTSTDSFVTEVNQTYAGSHGPDTLAVRLNEMYDRAMWAGMVDFTVDLSSARGTDTWKWPIISAAASTSDGTHPASNVTPLMAADIRPTLAKARNLLGTPSSSGGPVSRIGHFFGLQGSSLVTFY